MNKKIIENISFVILAGGKSRRMGRDKADLKIQRESFIQTLYGKAVALGFEEIVLSGYSGSDALLREKTVADIYPDKGPMSGIYSSMTACTRPGCFVISVDTPGIRPQLITDICEYHLQQGQKVTLLYYQNMYQTLTGVYCRSLMPDMKRLLEADTLSMMKIVNSNKCAAYLLEEEDPSLMNINTPEDYAHALKQWSKPGI